MLASLFSLFSCLNDIFITGLCLYAGNACLLWVNFNIVFCWILFYILCIFVFFCLWFSYYFAHECIPCLFPKFTTKKTFQKPLKFVYFIEFYLRFCWLVSLALETISGTNIFGAVVGDEVEDIFSLGYLSVLLVLRGELKPAHFKSIFHQVCQSGY